MDREKHYFFLVEVRENNSILSMKSQGKSGKSFFEKSYDPLNGMSMTHEYIQTTHE